MNATTLSVKVCRSPASPAIPPNNGCVAVPLSEKVHPPMAMNTPKSPFLELESLISTASWNSSAHGAESMVVTLYIPGSMDSKTKFTLASPSTDMPFGGMV
jgi:hypothetical protein